MKTNTSVRSLKVFINRLSYDILGVERMENFIYSNRNIIEKIGLKMR